MRVLLFLGALIACRMFIIFFLYSLKNDAFNGRKVTAVEDIHARAFLEQKQRLGVVIALTNVSNVTQATVGLSLAFIPKWSHFNKSL